MVDGHLYNVKKGVEREVLLDAERKRAVFSEAHIGHPVRNATMANISKAYLWRNIKGHQAGSVIASRLLFRMPKNTEAKNTSSRVAEHLDNTSMAESRDRPRWEAGHYAIWTLLHDVGDVPVLQMGRTVSSPK